MAQLAEEWRKTAQQDKALLDLATEAHKSTLEGVLKVLPELASNLPEARRKVALVLVRQIWEAARAIGLKIPPLTLMDPEPS